VAGGGGSKIDNAIQDRSGKKEEFPGFVQNTPPGNSFPQICVVSIKESGVTVEIAQDYRTLVQISNLLLFTYQ
jgi:hypothetical protein